MDLTAASALPLLSGLYADDKRKYGNLENRPVSRKPLPVEQK